MQANYLHAGHDHSWAEHLLEPLEPMLPGGEKTVGFLGHLLADAGQIYLMMLVVMFAVFLLQTYIDTDRMQRKLAGLKNIWGYLLAFGLGVISPFCSCSIVPVLMGLIAVGVPMSVCLCMLTTASLLNLTAVTALYSLEGVGFASVYLVCSLVIVALSSFLLSRCDLRDAARDYHLAEHHHHHDHCCDCGHEHHHDHPLSMAERCRSALCDTLSILKTTWFWILLSVAAAAALESYLPLEQITQVVADHSMLSGLLAAVIGFPLHSDVFSITPIIQLLRGMSAPVALSFALSAMVTSVPSVVLLTQALKPKAIVRYVGILVLLTLCCSLAALVVL